MVRVIQKTSGVFIGLLSSIPCPKPLRGIVWGALCKIFKIDLQDSILAIDEFETFQQLFTRKVKKREITGEIVSPSDGMFVESGHFQNGELPNIKCTAGKLLGVPLLDGTYTLFYLAPKNYHRVHSPVSGTLESVTRINGNFYPVNKIGMRFVDGLFQVNERVVFKIKTAESFVYLVMVGALNVGSIVPTVAPGAIRVGDEIGYFALGSSVLVVWDREINIKRQLGEIRYGDSL